MCVLRGLDVSGKNLGSHCLAGSPWLSCCPPSCLSFPIGKNEGLWGLPWRSSG